MPKINTEKILIVDDDRQSRALLKGILARPNRQIDEAEDGEEALLLHEENDYNLIITDIIMPRKEGLQLILELKKRWPDLKILAMSAGGRLPSETFSGSAIVEAKHYLEIAQEFGAHGVLKKPFSKSEITKLVDQCF
jgi:CheY-like chemotaxis protein